MPNIKSAIKRVEVGKKRATENRSVKSEVLTVVKNYNAMLANGKVEEAEKDYSHVVSVLDSAVNKGVMKKETADRKKSRLASALNKAKAK